MALKKTKPVPKTTSLKMVEAASPPPPVKSGKAGTMTAAAPQRAPVPGQLECYEGGIRLFHSSRFREAREMFGKAAKGADRGIAHRAELHARMCDRRLEEPVAVPQSAEDHYTYGVALINTRELAAAREHLEAALAMNANADHVL